MSISPLKAKLCYHLGHILARIQMGPGMRRGSLKRKVLKVYARALVEIINLGR